MKVPDKDKIPVMLSVVLAAFLGALALIFFVLIP